MPGMEDQFNKSAGDSILTDRLLAVLGIVQTINASVLNLDQTITLMVEKVRSILDYPLVSLFLSDRIPQLPFA